MFKKRTEAWEAGKQLQHVYKNTMKQESQTIRNVTGCTEPKKREEKKKNAF